MVPKTFIVVHVGVYEVTRGIEMFCASAVVKLVRVFSVVGGGIQSNPRRDSGGHVRHVCRLGKPLTPRERRTQWDTRLGTDMRGRVG